MSRKVLIYKYVLHKTCSMHRRKQIIMDSRTLCIPSTANSLHILTKSCSIQPSSLLEIAQLRRTIIISRFFLCLF